MKKWWMVWFTVPAIVNLWWESKPKDKRESAINDLTEAFMYTGSAWKKIWEKPPVEKKPELLFELGDFDVMLIDTHGIGQGRTHSSAFQSGAHSKIPPGTYKAICIESPSMDALKYARMGAWPEIKRYRDNLRQNKTINVNDTIDMSVGINLTGSEGSTDDPVPLGNIHFRWDCE